MGKYKLYKHPAYGHVYGPAYGTPVARCVWPALVNPKAPPPPKDGQAPGQPRYEVTLLLPKGDTQAEQFITAIQDVAAEMKELFNKGRSAKIGDCDVVKDGDSFDEEKYPYYKGHWIITPRNVKPVGVYNTEKEVIETANIVGGMKVRAAVTPLLTAHGVSYKLNMIKLVEDDGTRIGGGGGTDAMLALMDEDAEEGVAEVKEVKVTATAKKRTGKEAALDVL